MKRRVLIATAVFWVGFLFFAATLIKFIPAVLPTMSQAEASEAFRRYVLDPIPESVTNIRADQPKKFLGYRYTFRFNINRANMAILIDSGSLKRVWNVKYKKGYLGWAWDTWNGWTMNGADIIVYNSGFCRREPLWFNPQHWDNPETYAFDETVKGRMNTRVLLYNEKEGQAYYVVASLK